MCTFNLDSNLGGGYYFWIKVLGFVWILLIAENWKLKTENWKLKTYCWKHCNKIIFKLWIVPVRPSFKVTNTFFVQAGPWIVHGTSKKTQTHGQKRYANAHLIAKIWSLGMSYGPLSHIRLLLGMKMTH